MGNRWRSAVLVTAVLAGVIVAPARAEGYDRMNFGWIPQPRTVVDSVRHDYARRIPALLWETCVQQANTGRGEDSLTHVLATASLLKLVTDPAGRAELGRAFTATPPMADPQQLYQRCLDRLAPGWRPGEQLTTRPGWQQVVDDLMRTPAFTGKPGTDDVPTCRTPGSDTEDWDVTMALVTRVWGLLRTEPPAVLFGGDPAAHPAKLAALRYEIASRAWLQGGVAGVDEVVCRILGVPVPETENHTLLIRSTRFLHNESLPQVPTPPHRPKYVVQYNVDPNPDNATNGVRGYLRGFADQVLREDFREYNSRPYSRFQLLALLNLYDFAADASVRADAGRVLDFLALKHAAESRDNLRTAPFRRRQAAQSPALFQGGTTDAAFEVWTGGLAQPVNPAVGPGSYSAEMTLAAGSAYRPPAWLTGLQFDRRHRGFLQYFTGRGQQEVAYGGPDFVLTGGGRRTPCPYPGPLGACVGSGNDPGTLQPTVLIPHTVRTGTQNTVDRPTYLGAVRIESSWGTRVSCVDRDFACGETLAVPDGVVRDSPDCRTALPAVTVLRFDRSCSPDAGPSYVDNCFFVYGTQVIAEIAYLVTHSCDPAADDAARAAAFRAFAEYMTVRAAPRVEQTSCGPKVHTRRPPADRIDLTGVIEGTPVTVHAVRCAAEPGYELTVDGRSGFPGTGAFSGDLTPAGGRHPVTTVALSAVPEGGRVTLTATVADADARVPAGTVTFLAGADIVATAPVTPGPSGTVSASVTVAPDERRFTAVYSGDAVFTPAVGRST
ncbi:Ig-like domain-containing protein [Amycolatopsis suaedae]|uniref:Ig-like domain repeat protein n=1 Tax=Amycolatopsis suaedae TaxID=2510978 RepID=A0A4Q7JFI6_9PSEU|nr:Ig-like domain-containing protein [Amycolatopsis suaedae]RZQ65962.1 Ig-like domain repeat protein [Amycolatopsis suaedae]